MTPYTSFVAVVDTIRNPQAQSTDVNQPLPLPLQVSNLAVGGYRIGCEPGELILIMSAALALVLTWVRRMRRRKTCLQTSNP